MTVSTQVSRNEYTGNGATTQYDFTFRIMDKSDLLVQTLDASETITTLTLDADYSVTGVNRYPGGKVVLNTPLPDGYKISIERSIPVTQETSIRNQGGFFPEIHEDAFDKLTMIIQRMYGWWSGLALKKPSWLANYYDAVNNRIRNLSDPSQAQDAATKSYVDSSDIDLQQQITSNLNRSLRVPDSFISQLPPADERAWKGLGFDGAGQPKLQDPAGTGLWGYVPAIGSFEKGSLLTQRFEVLLWESTDEYWRWDGAMPMIVLPGSTPVTAGGTGKGKWIDVTDATLRSNLGSEEEGQGASLVKLTQGGTIQQAIGYYTPEMFSDLVIDGDWLPAINAAIAKMKQSPRSMRITGCGEYSVSGPIIISGFPSGFNLYLRSLSPHENFPNPSDYKSATPLFLVGDVGSMVGLDIRCDFVDGGKKADWVQVTKQGCGGSHFHLERAVNIVNGVKSKNVTWPTASNKVTGGYWSGGEGKAIDLQRGSSGTSPIVEGWIVDVNFITNFKRGGIHLKNGAQYFNFRGQTDFNGKYLSEITLDAIYTAEVTRGTYVNNGTNTAEVIAFYEQPKGVYKLLLDEGHDVSVDGSLFAANDTLNAGTWSANINAIRIPSVNNWYPDIIHDFQGSAFGKCMITAPYCGGVVGGMLHSSTILAAASYSAGSNSVNGAQWVSSPTALSLRDSFRNNYVFDAYATFIAPYRHLYMRNYRIYGVEVVLYIPAATLTKVRDFAKVGDGTVTTTKEVYRVTVSGTLTGVSGECLIYVSGSSIVIVNNTISGVTLSVSDFTLYAEQNSQSSLPVMFNFQRIL